jgi:hypothetical protein
MKITMGYFWAPAEATRNGVAAKDRAGTWNGSTHMQEKK